MSEAKLTADEAEVLRAVLSTLTIRDRTGELGVMHGMNRFVATDRTLNKQQRAAVDSAARKLGLHPGLPLYRC